MKKKRKIAIKDLETELEDLVKKMKMMAKEMGVNEFSKKAELDKPNVCHWLSGRRNYSYKKILKIAMRMEV